MALVRARSFGEFATRALLALTLALAALWATPSRAHVFETSEAYLYFSEDQTYFIARLRLNLEAVMAGIDPKVKDTSEDENAEVYDRLRALSGEELQAEFEGFRDEFLSGLQFEIDGKPAEIELDGEFFRDEPDLTKPRATGFRFVGKLTPQNETFRFKWKPEWGTISLKTESDRARSTHLEILRDGAWSTTLKIADVKTRTATDMVLNFLVIGYEHIVPLGLDHILFVLGIFLLSTKLRPILVQVTSFTIAHTVTLGLGAAGVVNLPSSIVEPLIAASIVYVAVENIWRPTLSPWRPAVVFLFGLLHGLGFAGILREFEISAGDFIVALISFNVGVELGQLTVILGGFLLVGIWFGKRAWYRQRVVIPGSAIIAAVGAFWFFQRILG